MKKQLLFLLTTILSCNCYSQISFEKGYYIDNNDQKIDCLVKNIDWKNNPTEIEYKLSENSESKKVTIKSIKEFGIDNISKYVRSTVNIDRSSESLNSLSKDKNPTFKEEELFLKVLVEGKANLYQYFDSNVKRFFFNKNKSNIKQLIFKSYKTTENKIGKNIRYKQQLWSQLKCKSFKMSKIKSLNYRKNDLTRFFTEYSKCHNNSPINFESKEKRDLFNLTFRPRLNSSSLTIENTDNNSRNTDFENKIGFGFGIEAEFILPFNKNKWAIAIEPNYQNYKSEKRTNISNVSGGILIANVNYNFIEIPVSLRYYFFINKGSKIFINSSCIFNLDSKPSIEFTRNDGSNFNSLKIKTRPNFGFGIGYKQNDKYSLEMRYQTVKNVLSDHNYWNSEYKTLSIIFGYSLF